MAKSVNMVKRIKDGDGMAAILKHAGHEIGANGKKVNADKCAKMVKLVKW